MWEPKELRLDWRHPWARTVGACRIRVFGGLRPGRDQRLLHIQRRSPTPTVPVWSLSSLSLSSLSLSLSSLSGLVACRVVPVSSGLVVLVWSHSLSCQRPYFPLSAGSGRTERRQLLRGDPRCIARRFTPAAPTRSSTRSISSLGHSAHHLCLNKWTSRMILRPRTRNRRRRPRAL